jgi:hypothetical protein
MTPAFASSSNVNDWLIDFAACSKISLVNIGFVLDDPFVSSLFPNSDAGPVIIVLLAIDLTGAFFGLLFLACFPALIAAFLADFGVSFGFFAGDTSSFVDSASSSILLR